MHFPVIARKFPVPLKKFPVPSLREFAKIIGQCQHVTGKFEARLGCFCKNSLFFPCLTGKSPLRPQRQVRRRLPAPPPYVFAFGWQATRRRLGVGVSAVAPACAKPELRFGEGRLAKAGPFPPARSRQGEGKASAGGAPHASFSMRSMSSSLSPKWCPISWISTWRMTWVRSSPVSHQ